MGLYHLTPVSIWIAKKNNLLVIPMDLEIKLEAQVSLYHSPDINKSS